MGCKTLNKADYYTLLRVPGIGVKSAKRIVQARRTAKLNFDDIKRMGVVLKRAVYFITCMGKMMYKTKIEENAITNHLIYDDRKKLWELEDKKSFKQLSLFEDFSITIPPTIEDGFTALNGQF